MIVAIDGPAGSGKSTLAREVAKRAGFTYLNSGKLYRAVTWWVIRHQITDRAEIIRIASELDIKVDGNLVQLNSCLLDKELHSDEVDARVAEVSSVPEVRSLVNRVLLDAARGKNVVVEGRDMATLVFPHAEVKWYLDASPEARARRRFNQGTSKLNYEEILSAIKTRDRIDTEKELGGLKIAPDALYLDTSDLTIETVCAKVLQSIQGTLHHGS